jgi:hypothetical protein
VAPRLWADLKGLPARVVSSSRRIGASFFAWSLATTPCHESRHYVRPDVRPGEHKLYGANSRNWRKSLILLARPKRFELLTPRFVGWSHPLSRHKIIANRTLLAP